MIRRKGISMKYFNLLTLAFLTLAIGCQTNQSEKWFPEILSEKVQADHFLPDYSYAGYKWGEEAIPEFKGKKIDVTDFGAVPNDKLDDTKAILAALNKANNTEGTVMLYFPRGRFILKRILFIERSDIVISGAGMDPKDGTVLYMPLALSELPMPERMKELNEYLVINNKRQIEKERGINEMFSMYTWTGGYIWTNFPGARGKEYMSEYNEPRNVLAEISGGKRGQKSFTVKDASNLKSGELVRINLFNTEGKESSLIKYLYDYQDLAIGSRHWETPDIPLTKQEVTITEIDGNKVTIKEPLLNDLRPEWHPDITEWKHISNVGIENLRFEFLYQEHKAHHLEFGFNAIYLTNTAQSWVRNVSFRNGDNGLLTDLCSNVTIENIEVYGRKYHYAVHFGDCYNLLAKNIYTQAPIVHSLTFNTGSRSCVYTNCLITQMPTLDQHSGLNYQNLFDNCVLYMSDPEYNPLTMGGAPYWLPSHAAFSTFWNIRFQFLFKKPDNDTVKIKGVTDSPSARLIGVYGNYPLDIYYPVNIYKEGMNRGGIEVPSLYEYQLKRRLHRVNSE